MTTMNLLSLGIQVLAMVVVAAGILLAQRPVLLAIIRDTMQQVLRDYVRKEEEQLRWDSHFREVHELRRRYDAEIDELKRRVSALENHVNIKCRDNS